MKGKSMTYLSKLAALTFCLLVLFDSYGQKTDFVIATIKKIDTTVLLKDTANRQWSKSFISAMKAQIIYLDIKSKGPKKVKNIEPIIVTELSGGEHICPFDFRLGITYKIPVTLSKYTSELVKSKYRNWHYRTLCYEVLTVF